VRGDDASIGFPTKTDTDSNNAAATADTAATAADVFLPAGSVVDALVIGDLLVATPSLLADVAATTAAAAAAAAAVASGAAAPVAHIGGCGHHHHHGNGSETGAVVAAASSASSAASSSSSSSSDARTLRVGILVVSDRCFNGTAEDRSGVAIRDFLLSSPKLNGSGGKLTTDREAILLRIVPDEVDKIQAVLKEWSNDDGDENTDAVATRDGAFRHLILTTGGTGFSPRDVTPEATAPLLHRRAPGLVAAIMRDSLQHIASAMLSRPEAGMIDRTLVVNLPGRFIHALDCNNHNLPCLFYQTLVSLFIHSFVPFFYMHYRQCEGGARESRFCDSQLTFHLLSDTHLFLCSLYTLQAV
jgi:molybdenum cofactor synthesis domain-containing protein